MKDSQRLALLKEVGGTKIYEERRRDSLKLMAESEGRQQRIQEVVRAGCHPAGCRWRCPLGDSSPYVTSPHHSNAAPHLNAGMLVSLWLIHEQGGIASLAWCEPVSTS